MAYDDMVCQPTLELLRDLRGEGFSSGIVSGGGLHFIRAFVKEASNISRRRVIGTTDTSSCSAMEDVPMILKDAGILFIDDKVGKPRAIEARIGQHPIMAVGNSDGGFEMLEWTTSGAGPRLGFLIHHTDAARECACERDGHVGKLARGLDEGPDRGWLIVDMARDWRQVWPAN